MQLHNKINRDQLKKRLMEETFSRKTISFYKYHYLENPQEFRDSIYCDWFGLNCFGRIYVAREGINAQMSVPEHHFESFLKTLEKYEILKGIPIKYAIEDDGKSFYKLTIKVRPKLVADGLDDGTYDVTNVGKHLSGLEFHHLIGQENTVVVDMRISKAPSAPKRILFAKNWKLQLTCCRTKKTKKYCCIAPAESGAKRPARI
jgi:UPF0176 protein